MAADIQIARGYSVRFTVRGCHGRATMLARCTEQTGQAAAVTRECERHAIAPRLMTLRTASHADKTIKRRLQRTPAMPRWPRMTAPSSPPWPTLVEALKSGKGVLGVRFIDSLRMSTFSAEDFFLIRGYSTFFHSRSQALRAPAPT
jgi:hypothetical protein